MSFCVEVERFDFCENCVEKVVSNSTFLIFIKNVASVNILFCQRLGFQSSLRPAEEPLFRLIPVCELCFALFDKLFTPSEFITMPLR